jgi:hypothetical protein
MHLRSLTFARPRKRHRLVRRSYCHPVALTECPLLAESGRPKGLGAVACGQDGRGAETGFG